MYPVGSNGASQAIIDARVLARQLALQPSIEQAVAAYDAVISQQELEDISRSYKRTAGFDPDTLNNRPSLSVR